MDDFRYFACGAFIGALLVSLCSIRNYYEYKDRIRTQAIERNQAAYDKKTGEFVWIDCDGNIFEK